MSYYNPYHRALSLSNTILMLFSKPTTRLIFATEMNDIHIIYWLFVSQLINNSAQNIIVPMGRRLYYVYLPTANTHPILIIGRTFRMPPLKNDRLSTHIVLMPWPYTDTVWFMSPIDTLPISLLCVSDQRTVQGTDLQRWAHGTADEKLYNGNRKGPQERNTSHGRYQMLCHLRAGVAQWPG